jgi:phage N-6-adenine-methyltransferase
VVDKALFSSDSKEWETPDTFFDKLNEVWKFNLDPCATDDNTKVKSYYYTEEINGLKEPWHGPYDAGCGKRVPGRVFCNPPYGKEIGQWVKKAVTEVQNGNAEVVVMLLPARTCTAWWHQWVEPNASEINFIRGRLKFGGAKNSAPFPSVVVVFKNELTWPQKLFRLPGKRREGISRESIRL